MVSHDIELVDDRETKWIETKSNETVKSIQDIDQSSFKYFSHDNTESNWVRPDGTLCVPESSLNLLDPGLSTGTSMNIFVFGVEVEEFTHANNLIIKNLKSARETGELSQKTLKIRLLDEFFSHFLIFQIIARITLL